MIRFTFGRFSPPRAAFFCLCFLAFAVPAHLQQQPSGSAGRPVTLEHTFDGKYSYTERTNLSKYVNGKYIGLTHREVRANMNYAGDTPGGRFFSGFFYVTEETLRDMKNVSLPVDEIVPTEFAVNSKGALVFKEDNGYPRMRNFPAFPEGAVKPGDYWEAEALRIVDPKNSGRTTELPVYVAYTFSGTEEYRGRAVHRIKAKYATRLGKHNAVRSTDESLSEAHGTHDADILVDAETGLVMMILDRMDETFVYSGGESVRLRGSSAAFTELAVNAEKGALPRAINRVAAEARDSARSSGVSMPESADDTFTSGPAGGSSGGRGAADAPSSPSSSGSLAERIRAENAGRAGQPPRSGGGGASSGGRTQTAGIDEPFTVDVTAQGIKLSVRDIRFKPDSDEILPEEKWRIDAIAQTLKLADGMDFLVEGHTASVGKPAGEKDLSVRRAKKITEELSARGIPAESFIYTGYGGTKPVADNATAEGRAANRRVEITILGAE